MTYLAHLALLALAVSHPGPGVSAPPTYLFEWSTTSSAIHDRLTLFLDRTLIWKTETEGEKPVIKSRRLSEEEFAFYQGYFGDASAREAEGDHASGITGDRIAISRIDVRIPDHEAWSLSFDSLTPMTMPLLRTISALEGLRDSIDTVLPSPQEFELAKIPPGTILKHRSGALFRIVSIDRNRDVVELEGVTVPYSLYSRLEDLRFSFLAP